MDDITTVTGNEHESVPEGYSDEQIISRDSIRKTVNGDLVYLAIVKAESDGPYCGKNDVLLVVDGKVRGKYNTMNATEEFVLRTVFRRSTRRGQKISPSLDLIMDRLNNAYDKLPKKDV